MNKTKIIKSTAGATLIGAGYGLKLAKWGLSASEVVLNGAANLANDFAKTSSLGIGKSLLNGIKQQTGKLSAYLVKKGKQLTH